MSHKKAKQLRRLMRGTTATVRDITVEEAAGILTAFGSDYERAEPISEELIKELAGTGITEEDLRFMQSEQHRYLRQNKSFISPPFRDVSDLLNA